MSKRIYLKAFREFLSSEQIGGIILFCCVVISLSIANSSAADAFQDILDIKIGYSNAFLNLEYPVSLWINDGLMSIFFLLVGLEI